MCGLPLSRWTFTLVCVLRCLFASSVSNWHSCHFTMFILGHFYPLSNFVCYAYPAHMAIDTDHYVRVAPLLVLWDLQLNILVPLHYLMRVSCLFKLISYEHLRYFLGLFISAPPRIFIVHAIYFIWQDKLALFLKASSWDIYTITIFYYRPAGLSRFTTQNIAFILYFCRERLGMQDNCLRQLRVFTPIVHESNR